MCSERNQEVGRSKAYVYMQVWTHDEASVTADGHFEECLSACCRSLSCKVDCVIESVHLRGGGIPITEDWSRLGVYAGLCMG